MLLGCYDQQNNDTQYKHKVPFLALGKLARFI